MLSLASPAGPTTTPAGAVLDVVIPVYNEEADLGPCVRRLHAHLTGTFPYPFRITVADNASVDGTLAVANQLAAELPGVAVRHLSEKGRGRALRTAWAASDAPVLAYMDVDLSTDLNALLPLVAPLLTGHSDVSIGTRLSRGSRVVRGARREFISRCYNLLLRGTLSARFSDAQCGVKAIRKDVADQLLPLVQDPGWFFDTELLVLAQRAGLRIHEVPVDWVDDPDSHVEIVPTAVADLKGIARLGRALLTGALPLHGLRARFGREPLVDGVPANRPRQRVGKEKPPLPAEVVACAEAAERYGVGALRVVRHVLAGGQASRGPVAVLDRQPGGDEAGPEGRTHARTDGHVMQHDQAEEHTEQQPDADPGAPATEVVTHHPRLPRHFPESYTNQR